MSVKGFATIDNVALINVEGTGMVGVQVQFSCTILDWHRVAEAYAPNPEWCSA